MPKWMWIGFAGILSLLMVAAPVAFARTGDDTIDLRDGTTVYGEVIAQNAGQLYLATDDGVQRINIRDIKTIHFGPRVSVPTIPPEGAEKS